MDRDVPITSKWAEVEERFKNEPIFINSEPLE